MKTIDDPVRAAPTGWVNRLVGRVLQSRFHPVLSRWVCLIAYDGRRSGTAYCTPVQYATTEEGIVISVGNAAKKVWWQNFAGPDDRTIAVLRGGNWHSWRAIAVTAHRHPDAAARLTQSYLERYPRARRTIAEANRTETSVFVHLTPNGPTLTT